MLHIDAHFARGYTHPVCQDYAVAGARIAVLCDGCSGAPDSDVGARLLAHAALNTPPGGLHDRAWLERSESARSVLGLGMTALDATCIVAEADDDAITVTMFGDGVVAARRCDGSLAVIEVSYPRSAPPYPSYALCPQRKQAYDDEGLGVPTLHTTGCAPSTVPGGPGLSWVFPRAQWRSVLVGSDGLGAFRQSDQTIVPAPDVVSALFRYPSPRGAFVTRRLRKFLAKEAPTLGLQPEDDVAVAALCWENP
ncbi:MAG: protein phosphatase 2C domain-containing protein [Nannocystales bacterium]